MKFADTGFFGSYLMYVGLIKKKFCFILFLFFFLFAGRICDIGLILSILVKMRGKTCIRWPAALKFLIVCSKFNGKGEKSVKTDIFARQTL